MGLFGGKKEVRSGPKKLSGSELKAAGKKAAAGKLSPGKIKSMPISKADQNALLAAARGGALTRKQQQAAKDARARLDKQLKNPRVPKPRGLSDEAIANMSLRQSKGAKW